VITILFFGYISIIKSVSLVELKVIKFIESFFIFNSFTSLLFTSISESMIFEVCLNIKTSNDESNSKYSINLFILHPFWYHYTKKGYKIKILYEIFKKIKGKDEKIKLILSAFFANGHVLIEDLPGVGKTTIAKTIAEVLGLEFKRIQFTSDLLPSDIIGVNYFDVKSGEFILKKGPIFTEILLADEINRASPKTQSALLEAMEERQVSIDGTTYKLSDKFFVIATQNPLEEVGTFALPYSQLDRFMISLSIGYLDRESEKEVLLNRIFDTLNSFPDEVEYYKQKQKEIYIKDTIIELIVEIGDYTRKNFKVGFSTRALISMMEMAKSWAMLEEREYVIDDDIAKIIDYVAKHRINNSEKLKKIFF